VVDCARGRAHGAIGFRLGRGVGLSVMAVVHKASVKVQTTEDRLLGLDLPSQVLLLLAMSKTFVGPPMNAFGLRRQIVDLG
jgi:hypothetical protein